MALATCLANSAALPNLFSSSQGIPSVARCVQAALQQPFEQLRAHGYVPWRLLQTKTLPFRTEDWVQNKWDNFREEHSMDWYRFRIELYFREIWEPLVHMNFMGNSYGPMAPLPCFQVSGNFVWTNGAESSSKVAPWIGIGPWMPLLRIWRGNFARRNSLLFIVQAQNWVLTRKHPRWKSTILRMKHIIWWISVSLTGNGFWQIKGCAQEPFSGYDLRNLWWDMPGRGNISGATEDFLAKI